MPSFTLVAAMLPIVLAAAATVTLGAPALRIPGPSPAGIAPCRCIPQYTAFIDRFHRMPNSTADFFARCTVFCDNLDAINAHNADPSATYTAEIKMLHDLTAKDRASALGFGYKAGRDRSRDRLATPLDFGGGDDAAEVDWFLQDRVTDVRNQGSCGDCWAESATGVLESALAQQTGLLRQLSVQQAAECTPQETDRGCEGGWPVDALRYAQRAGGLCLESAYPTVIGDGADRACNASAVANCTVKLQIADVVSIPKGNETMLIQAAQRDVVSIAIDASGAGFYSFAGGVYNGVFNRKADCSPTALDHAVIVTGMGVFDRTQQPFYVVRNSWGAQQYGMSGYIMMERNLNVCGLAQDAAFVTF